MNCRSHSYKKKNRAQKFSLTQSDLHYLNLGVAMKRRSEWGPEVSFLLLRCAPLSVTSNYVKWYVSDEPFPKDTSFHHQLLTPFRRNIILKLGKPMNSFPLQHRLINNLFWGVKICYVLIMLY